LLKNALDSLPPASQHAFAKLSLENTYENIFRDIGRGLSSAGRSVGQALPSIARAVAPVAQVALPIVGTMVGGPVGAMAGNALGGLLGQAGGQAGAGTRPRQAALPQAQTAAPQAQVNPAASQLMSMIANPQFLQAILGQVLGSAGQGAATVTSAAGQQTAIPFGALMNSLSELAIRAAEESVRTGSYESESYLQDSYGDYTVDDPSDPAQRADAVLDLLNESYHIHSYADQEENDDAYDGLTEWFVRSGMVR
jgi:hypothetical protein